MFDDEVGAASVADERARAGIVHRVGEIAHQRHMETEPCHLSRAESAIENADVGMDAHQRDIDDAFQPAVVVDFLTALAHTVEANDIDR